MFVVSSHRLLLTCCHSFSLYHVSTSHAQCTHLPAAALEALRAAVLVGVVLVGAPDAARPVAVQRLASGPARTEVLVTTSLESEGRYLARTGDVYSIDQADAVLYLPALPAPPPAMGPPPAPVKTWQVVP